MAEQNVSDQLLVRKRSIESTDVLQTNERLSNTAQIENAIFEGKNVDRYVFYIFFNTFILPAPKAFFGV